MKGKILTGLLILGTLAFGMETIGAKGALADMNLTNEEMLTYALQDEYLARNEYKKTMEKFGEVRPFSNIKKSEEQHISMLLPLFEKYSVESVDEEKLKEFTVVAKDLKEAAKICVDAEVDNIAMYDKFLSQKDLPEDIKIVFQQLKKASENHLEAFKRQL